MPDKVWVIDHDWVMLSTSTMLRCRAAGYRMQNRCRNRAKAEFRRKNGWWAYCEEHLYGRRIKDGHIEQEVAADSPLAQGEVV